MFHVKHISVKHLPCRRRVFHTLKTKVELVKAEFKFPTQFFDQ